MVIPRAPLSRWIAAVTGATAVLVMVCGCAKVDSGTAVRADAVTTVSTSTASAAVTNSPSMTAATDVPESSEPGVLETTPRPVPANSTTCAPPESATTVASVADPAAPRVSLTLPDGWSTTPGSGTVGIRITGPAQMTGEVSITATTLDAAAAFSKYSDDVMDKYPISTVSILPAEICEYSGQKLMGTWADDPDRSLQYYDRIAHIWTNSKNYLVAVHIEAPSNTAGFDQTASVVTGDFGVVIP